MKRIVYREALKTCRRVVVKVGTRVLVQRNGRPDPRRMQELVRGLAALGARGIEVSLVTSGAIGAGMQALGMTKRPRTLPELQMAAAVGQTRLMAAYDRLFAAHRRRVGQVLLTHDGLNERRRHLNARNTMLHLLRNGIVPIVNENDTVAVDEIRVGDNDVLAALVALLIDADLLILLTSVDGLRAPAANGRTRRVSWVSEVTADELGLAQGKGGDLSTGGMSSKLQAAGMAAQSGIPVVIANGRKPGILEQVLDGQDVGTLIAKVSPGGGPLISGRKRWIAYFHRPRGTLVVDEGAREALLAKGRSLLPIGVREVEGSFEAGSVVSLRGPDGDAFARGLTDYSSEDIRAIRGLRTDQIEKRLGRRDYDEVIHRDNMVLLERQGKEENP